LDLILQGFDFLNAGPPDPAFLFAHSHKAKCISSGFFATRFIYPNINFLLSNRSSSNFSFQFGTKSGIHKIFTAHKPINAVCAVMVRKEVVIRREPDGD
jgi:hypothetical protein